MLVPLINLDAARIAGINRADIANAITQATDGSLIGQMRRDDDLIPIKLRSSNANLAQFDNIPVRSLLGSHTCRWDRWSMASSSREKRACVGATTASLPSRCKRT